MFKFIKEMLVWSDWSFAYTIADTGTYQLGRGDARPHRVKPLHMLAACEL